MSHVGYFIEIEGVKDLLATESYTGAGSWGTRPFISCFSISGIGSFEYSIDPYKRVANVGVMSITLVDTHGTGDAADGNLTDLFAIRKTQPRLHLKQTIQQSDSMSGAGTVQVSGSLASVSFPTYFYLERETFYSSTMAADDTCGGITRAQYGSRAMRHAGYADENGYTPEVRLVVPSWKDRICSIYRVVDGNVASATKWWAGPILDLSPTGVNTWVLKIGSVLKLLETEIKPQSIPLAVDMDQSPDPNHTGSNWHSSNHWQVTTVKPNSKTIRRGIATTSAGSADASYAWINYSYSTNLLDPDGYWPSQHGIKFVTGKLGPTFRIDSSNDQIRMDESPSGGSAFTVTLDHAAAYNTDDLAAEIKAKLEAGGSLTYTVSGNSSGIWTIAASNTVDIKWNYSQRVRSLATVLGYKRESTGNGTSHTADYEHKPTADSEPLMIIDFDNATGKITHYNYNTDVGPSSSGDYFDVIRLHRLPPTNKYGLFPAVINRELVAIRQGYELMFASEGESSPGWHVDKNAADRWICYRGIETTEIAAHASGDSIEEVLTNYRVDGDRLSTAEWIGYSGPVDELAYKGIRETKRNPVLWFLELWHSTGSGWNGSYDVLHEEHGAGHQSSLIDVDAFESLAEKTPTYRLAYTEPVKLKDILIRDICIPCGLYPVVTSTGKLSLKRLERNDTANFADATFTTGNITKGSVTSRQDHVQIIPRIKIDHGYNPVTKGFDHSFSVGYYDAEHWYPDAKPEEHKCHIWPLAAGHDSTADMVDANVLAVHGARIIDRLGVPLVMVGLEHPLSSDAMPAVPGDVVKVTVDNAVPLPTGTRSLSSEWFEVYEASVNLLASTINYQLAWLGWYRDSFSRWSFAAEASAYSATTKEISVSTVLMQSGYTCDDYVEVGDKLRLHYIADSRKGGGTYAATEEVTVATVAATTLTISLAPAHTVLSGDVVVYCDYDNATSDQKRLAFIAEDPDETITGDETVGSAGSNPYVYR